MPSLHRSFCASASLAAALLVPPRQAPAQTPIPPNPAAVPTDRLSEPAWADHHTAVLAGLPAHADTPLLLIGGSVIANYAKSAPPSEDFQPVWLQYYAPRRALNLGFSGDTTANVLWRLDHGEVAGLHPRLVILLIGAEDTARHQTARQTEAGIDAVVADIERRLPDTRILLLGLLPTPLPSKDANFDVNSDLGARYASHSDPRVTFLDVGSVYYARGVLNGSLFYGTALKPPLPVPHPNPVGQRLLASAIEPTVARLMGDTPVRPAPVRLPPPPSQP